MKPVNVKVSLTSMTSYLFACSIMEELKVLLEKQRQLKYAKKEFMNALSTWIKAFNDKKKNHYVKYAKSL